jgi:CRISPR/Cas system type I-B associated protein Csh2 (Cas7 group RAMP superfamily)
MLLGAKVAKKLGKTKKLSQSRRLTVRMLCVNVYYRSSAENYGQLFSSFVNKLKNNHLKIEVKFTASNSSANPLTDNSPIIKSVKESASQLGLEFEVEE